MNVLRKRIVFAICAIALVGFGGFFPANSFASAAVHWGYSGENGPEHWGELADEFIMCAQGKNQSPINLTNFVEADLAPLEFAYKTVVTEILNNGHTVQVNYAPGGMMMIDGMTFELKQFHFHAPSENHIKGQSFPMEAHFVHADKEGNLAVIALMFEEGESHPVIEALWKQLPVHEGDTHTLEIEVDPLKLLPQDTDYYRFNGSLTTPPCSEGVRWFVMKQAVSVSPEQVEAFSHALHEPNNRPVLPVNARSVLQ